MNNLRFTGQTLWICGDDYKPITPVTLYNDLSYTERFCDRDSFEFEISRDAKNAQHLLPGRVLIVPMPEDSKALIIKQIEVTDKDIIVSGNDYLWDLLTARLALAGTKAGSGTDTQTGAAETVARHYIEANITAADNLLRRDDQVRLEAAHETPLGDEVTIEGRLQTLQDIMESICTQGKIGIRGVMKEDNTTPSGWYVEIQIRSGTDRSGAE